MRPAAAAILLSLFIAAAPPAYAVDVDLAVVLAADVSRSIDDGEFELQRKGYAAALNDPRVLAAIQHGRNKAIAVSFVEWSGDDEQSVVVDWSVIRDEEGSGGVAARILAAPRSFMGRTAIGSAIDFAVRHFARATARSTRRVIDVSGDGTSNSGREVAAARDDAVGHGITINGLAIVNNRPNFGYSAHTNPPGGLPGYYRKEVIGGPDAFLLVVHDFQSFAEAMAKKLEKEIEISQRRPVARTAAR